MHPYILPTTDTMNLAARYQANLATYAEYVAMAKFRFARWHGNSGRRNSSKVRFAVILVVSKSLISHLPA